MEASFYYYKMKHIHQSERRKFYHMKLKSLSFEKKNLFKRIVLSFFVFIAVCFYIKYPFYKYVDAWWSFWLWVLGLLVLLKVLFVLALEVTRWWRGIEGEEIVESEASWLPEKFEILENLTINGHGDVDMVIVGPTGIWMIEVKSHSGRIDFNGEELTRNGEVLEKNFLKQAWAEAYAVRDTLKENLKREFTVQPVVVFSSSDAQMNFGMKPVKGVYVIGLRWLRKLIQGNEIQRLSNEMVKDIVKVLQVFK